MANAKSLDVRAVYSARSSAAKSSLKAVAPLMPTTITSTDERYNSHVKLPTTRKAEYITRGFSLATQLFRNFIEILRPT